MCVCYKWEVPGRFATINVFRGVQINRSLQKYTKFPLSILLACNTVIYRYLGCIYLCSWFSTLTVVIWPFFVFKTKCIIRIFLHGNVRRWRPASLRQPYFPRGLPTFPAFLSTLKPIIKTLLFTCQWPTDVCEPLNDSQIPAPYKCYYHYHYPWLQTMINDYYTHQQVGTSINH